VKERFGLVLLAALSLTACNERNEPGANTAANASYQGRSFSVFGKLRPQADPNAINEIHNEEDAARRARQEELERQAAAQRQANQAQGDDPNQRNLPGVANSSFSGGLPSVNGGAGQLSGLSGDPKQIAAQAEQAAQAITSSWGLPGSNSGSGSAPPPPPAQSYGINYTTPSPGFVPPPPAVSLSSQAVPMYGGPPPPDYNPYANPYAAYGQAPAAPPVPTHAPSSGFGAVTTGASRAASSGDEDEPSRKKKEKPMQIITPTGMEARSPYKQRDELRMLWKGALQTSLSSVSSDGKFSDGIAKVDVGLPGEATKGSLSIAQRQVDAIFKNNGAVDRKVIGTVKKTQTDLVQAYYRYLYSYNKYFLGQQQVQARKQELDCADSQAEKQRATVDLANTQQEADASREDMRSAQGDLASVAGASAARTVIKNVSGVTPSLEQIAADSQPQARDKGGEGGSGGLFKVFGFGKGKSRDDDQSAEESPKVAAESKGKERKEKEKDKDVKEKKKGKGDKQQIAAKPDASSSTKADAGEAAPASSGAGPSVSAGPVSFELKDVKTTPRKSVLRVVVKNTGGDNFSFDADAISVAEGNNKLADASVNAEFDSTIVQPSQEVTGTITIFGRPWNDKLTVSLSSGNKPIFLHR
jgi:hypothetical protein